MANHGTLYMIPCPIVDYNNDTIPAHTINMVHKLTHFIVERARTSRRWLSSIDHPTPIDELQILELDKNDAQQDLSSILGNLAKGTNVGVISEAGCPAIADPGHRAVKYAHLHGYKVVPLVGPSSILMALMASGFNGQGFAFWGYLPSKKPEVNQRLKTLESNLNSTGLSQIFMEAPYRNAFLLEQIVATLQPNTMLCVACDINAKSESITTKPVKEWKKTNFKQYHKRPTIFLIGR